MSAALMSEREAIAAFLCRVLLRVETLVDHDAPIIEKDDPDPYTLSAEERSLLTLLGKAA